MVGTETRPNTRGKRTSGHDVVTGPARVAVVVAPAVEHLEGAVHRHCMRAAVFAGDGAETLVGCLEKKREARAGIGGYTVRVELWSGLTISAEV